MTQKRINTKAHMFLGIIIFLILSIAFGLKVIQIDTAYAISARTNYYDLTFSYEEYVVTNGVRNNLSTGDNVTITPNVKLTDSTTTQVSVKIYGGSTNYTSDVFTSETYLCSNTCNIQCNSGYTSYEIGIYRQDDSQLCKVNSSTLKTTALTDGTFFIRINAYKDSGSTRYGVQLSAPLKIDVTAPVIDGTSAYTNSPFSIFVTDISPFTLYYATPTSNGYSVAEGGFYNCVLPKTGTYEFYAVDAAENASNVYTVTYETVRPEGIVNFTDGTTTTSSKSTTMGFSYSAQDSGSGIQNIYYKAPNMANYETYNGSIIPSTSAEGSYRFYAIDRAGNMSDEIEITLDFTKPYIVLELEKGEYIEESNQRGKATHLIIYAIDEVSNIKELYMLIDGEVVASGKNSFYMEIDLSNDYSTTIEFYCVDGANNRSDSFYFINDLLPPKIIADVDLNTIVNSGFTISAEDQSDYAIWYRLPNETEYICGTDILIVEESDLDGIYYFYAEDVLGNKSVVYSISKMTTIEANLTTTEDGTIIITFNGSIFTASLNNEPISSGTEVNEEGTYFLVVKNASNMQETYTFSVDHFYTPTEEVAPTCTEYGYTIYTCSHCGATYKENTLEPIGHFYVLYSQKAPTCTEYGKDIYTCNKCGHTHEDKTESPLGHNYITSTKSATCTEAGGQVHKCSRCEDQYITGEIPPLNHSYSTHIKEDATCTTDGIREFICTICGDTYEEIILAKGHNYEIISEIEEGDYLHTRKRCTECGDEINNVVNISKLSTANQVITIIDDYKVYIFSIYGAIAGIYAIVIGVLIILARKAGDKEKAMKLLKNLILGIVIISIILVAIPLVIRAICSLV